MTTNLNQYVQDATRTESIIDSVRTNQYNLLRVMNAFAAVGNLLDMVKKNAYYGKPIDQVKWNHTIADALGSLADLTRSSNAPAEQLNIDARLFHAIVGIATESTELIEAVQRAVQQNTEIDIVNVLEEMGDISWYQAILVDATKADWDQILRTNITKLKARYPDKFTTDDAINRDLVAERKILEGDV